jgi:hypothetical protein
MFLCFFIFFYFDIKLIPPPSSFFLFSNFFPGPNFDGYQNSVQKVLFPGGGVYPHVVQPTLDDKIKDDGWNKTEIRFKQRNDFGFILLVFIGGISKSKMSLCVFYFFL